MHGAFTLLLHHLKCFNTPDTVNKSAQLCYSFSFHFKAFCTKLINKREHGLLKALMRNTHNYTHMYELNLHHMHLATVSYNEPVNTFLSKR